MLVALKILFIPCWDGNFQPNWTVDMTTTLYARATLGWQ